MFAPVHVASLRAHVGCWGGDGGGSCRLVPWHRCSVSSWLWLLVGPLVAKRRWWSGVHSSSCIVGRSRSWTMVEGARRWWWGAGSRLSTVVVVGAPWGAWFVGDVALPRSWPGLLLWWVTSLVVVTGVVVAMGTSFSCDVACMPRSLLAFSKRRWRWWLLAVDERCGWWTPWATVVTWHRWVGVADDGGG